MTRTWLAAAGAVIAVGLLTAAAYLGLRGTSVADARLDCGPISAGEQRSLNWLSQLRSEDKLPLRQIALGRCESGARTKVSAVIETGRSASVQEFFTARHGCDVKNVEQGCRITAEHIYFDVRLDYVGTEWIMQVASAEA